MRNTHIAADSRRRCPEPRSRAIIVQMVYWCNQRQTGEKKTCSGNRPNVLLGSGLESGRPDQGLALFIHFAMQKTVKLAHLLSPSPVLLWHVPARIFLFKADGFWIFEWPMVFLFSKESYGTGAQTLRKLDSRSTWTAHHMRSHCCPRRNQHC